MRVGYIYAKTDRALAKANCDVVFHDDPRDEDREAMRGAFIRLQDAGGGTLVVVRRSDLGTGMRIKRMMERLEEINVEVEVFDKPADGPPLKRGRKSVFDPSEEQRGLLTDWWSGDILYQKTRLGCIMYVIKWADWEDNPTTRKAAENWLARNIGPRSGKE